MSSAMNAAHPSGRHRAAVRVVVAVALFLPIVVCAFFVVQRLAADSVWQKLSRGSTAIPDFSLLGARGGLSKESIKGQKTALVFYSQHCGACDIEVRRLLQLAPKYRSSVDLAFLSIDDHPKENPDGRFFKGAKSLAGRLGIDRVPTMLFVDSDGMIIKTTQGILPEGQLEKMLDHFAISDSPITKSQ